MVVVFVSAPVGAVALEEIEIKFVENFFVAQIACRGESVENGLKHFGIAPPAAATEHMAYIGIVVILTEEAVHNGVANIGIERPRHIVACVGDCKHCGFGLSCRHIPEDNVSAVVGGLCGQTKIGLRADTMR